MRPLGLQGRWLPELQEMVRIIDRRFSRYLRAMGCNGQVLLHCRATDAARVRACIRPVCMLACVA